MVRVYTGSEITSIPLTEFKTRHLKEIMKFMRNVLEDHDGRIERIVTEGYPNHWRKKIVWRDDYMKTWATEMETVCDLDIEYMRRMGKYSIQQMRKYLNSSRTS